MTGISKISQAVAEPSAAAEGGEDEIPSVAALGAWPIFPPATISFDCGSYCFYAGAKIPDASDANLDSKKAS
jgi:hypothetical protein